MHANLQKNSSQASERDSSISLSSSAHFGGSLGVSNRTTTTILDSAPTPRACAVRSHAAPPNPPRRPALADHDAADAGTARVSPCRDDGTHGHVLFGSPEGFDRDLPAAAADQKCRKQLAAVNYL